MDTLFLAAPAHLFNRSLKAVKRHLAILLHPVRNSASRVTGGRSRDRRGCEKTKASELGP